MHFYELGSRRLLVFVNGQYWTVFDSLEGTQIFGATGSGKTTGSGEAIAIAFLDAGFGGLILTVKPDERDNWRRYFIKSGRAKEDLIIIDPRGRWEWSGDNLVLRPGTPLEFNFLDHEFNRLDQQEGYSLPLTLNLVSLFLATLSTGEATGTESDPYWRDALRELLTHVIDLVALGTEAEFGTPRLSLGDMAAVVRSAPQTRDEVQSPTWQKKSRCYELLRAATAKADDLEKRTPGRLDDLRETVAFFLSDFPSLAQRTRSIIISSFTSKAAGLLRSPLRRHFCSGTSPEACPATTHAGKVILLNLPVKEFGEVGRFAQVVYKTVWQRATERRSLVGDWRPVFLWADEAQHFITSEDMLFQQTARSRWAATVYLTQNLPNYHAALGGRNAQAVTESLLGNLQTKVFHQNSDPTSNEWGERLFAKATTHRRGTSFGLQQNQGLTTNFQESIEPVVPAIRFTKLKKGGAPDFKVESIIYCGGRVSSLTGSPLIEHTFNQNFGGDTA